MTKRRRFPRIFFGWWTVLAGGLLALWGHGYHAYGFSALFKPISDELGFSRAATSVGASIGGLEGGLEAPVVGWITDRFGPRWLIVSGVALIGLSLILMAYIQTLWAFYLVWGIMLGTGVNIALSLPVQTAIANWFVRKRGLATSIQIVFSGLSGVLVLPLIAWLITTQGWRTTCLIGGVVMLVIGLPLSFFAIKQRRPEYYGMLPDGATSEEELSGSIEMVDRGVKYAAEVEELEFTLKQALKTPTFWLLIIANTCHSLAMPALNIHGVPFLTDIGMDSLKAAGMLAMMVSASIPARLLGGWLADRVRKGQMRFIIGGAYLLQTIGFALYLLSPTVTMIYLWFIVYGIGMGAGFSLMFPMRARYFGRKSLGAIAGISRLFMAPATIIAPIYVGWVYDTTGSYTSAFTLVAALLAVSGVLMLFIPPPRVPSQPAGIPGIA